MFEGRHDDINKANPESLYEYPGNYWKIIKNAPKVYFDLNAYKQAAANISPLYNSDGVGWFYGLTQSELDEHVQYFYDMGWDQVLEPDNFGTHHGAAVTGAMRYLDRALTPEEFTIISLSCNYIDLEEVPIKGTFTVDDRNAMAYESPEKIVDLLNRKFGQRDGFKPGKVR